MPKSWLSSILNLIVNLVLVKESWASLRELAWSWRPIFESWELWSTNKVRVFVEIIHITIEVVTLWITSFTEIHRAAFFMSNIWRLLSFRPCILKTAESLKMVMLFINIVWGILILRYHYLGTSKDSVLSFVIERGKFREIESWILHLVWWILEMNVSCVHWRELGICLWDHGVSS